MEAPCTFNFLATFFTHQHSDTLLAASDDDMRSGHALHVADPVASLYVDTPQDAHVPPAVPVYPTVSQLQLVREPLSVVVREFAGHTEYRPTDQFEHAVSPS